MPEEKEVLAYEEALNTIEALNPAPQILAKAQKKLRDSKVEINDLVEIIRADASLTTDIIRISNSAFYGYETKASNLHDAIHRIGFGEVTRLIGLTISKSLLNRTLEHYNIPQDDYWATSVTTALIMEHLARLHMEAADDAYTVGLLHAVGRIVINQLMDDFKLDTVWDGKQPINQWERDAVGFTYAYAGAMILKRWDFSSKMTHPILYQLNPPKPEMGWSLHAYLYFAREIIARAGNDLSNPDFDLDEGIQHLMLMLTIQEEALRDMLKSCREQFLAIKSGLDM